MLVAIADLCQILRHLGDQLGLAYLQTRGRTVKSSCRVPSCPILRVRGWVLRDSRRSLTAAGTAVVPWRWLDTIWDWRGAFVGRWSELEGLVSKNGEERRLQWVWGSEEVDLRNELTVHKVARHSSSHQPNHIRRPSKPETSRFQASISVQAIHMKEYMCTAGRISGEVASMDLPLFASFIE